MGEGDLATAGQMCEPEDHVVITIKDSRAV